MSANLAPAVSLPAMLRPLRRRAVWLGVLRGLAAALLVCLLCLLTVMWLDLTVPLSVTARSWALPIASLLGVLAMLRVSYQSITKWREPELAGRVDQIANTGGQVATGLGLSRQINELSVPLSQGLASIAVRKSIDFVRGADPREAISHRPAVRLWYLFASLLICLLIFAAILPRLAWTQTRRILSPEATQLPYSPTLLTVAPGDVEVVYGEDLEVTARVEGPEVEAIDLIIDYPDGNRERLPMLGDGQRQWRVDLKRVIESATYFAAAGSARSETHRLDVKTTPQILSSSFRLTPPAYTSRGAIEGPLTSAGIAGLLGTEVEFRVASNRPLANGLIELELTSGIVEIPMQPAVGEPKVVVGSFELSSPGRFSVKVFDVAGTANIDPLGGPLRITVDQPPMIAITTPRAVSLATPDVMLPVEVIAEDDYGITSLTLFRSLNGTPGSPLALDFEPGSRVNAQLRLPLSAYGLEPGDEITLFARTEDNHPLAPQGAESQLVTIQIISSQQLAELQLARQGVDALLSKQRQVQRMLQALTEELASVAEQANAEQAEGANASEQNVALQQTLAEAMKNVRETAAKLRQMAAQPLPIDVDQELAEQTDAMADRLETLAERLQELVDQQAAGEPLTAEQQQELAELAAELMEESEQHQQRAVEPTERLTRTLPLAAAQQQFAQLVDRQQNLAIRIAALRNADGNDPAMVRRSEELRREQQQVERILDDLLDEIQSQANRLPADPELDSLRSTALAFVEAVRGSQAQSEMLDAQENLLADQATRAAEAAQRAAEILASFLSEADSMGGQACENCRAAFNPQKNSPSLGNSIEQLLQRLGLGPGQSPGQNQGMGPGSGGGGGYSARASTANNIGIYGGLPTPVSQPRSGNGGDGGSAVASSPGGGTAGEQTLKANSSSPVASRGDAGGQVPTIYHRRVSDYFRKLSEELGGQEP